ncbi:helix-turn-helix domain-containing protein [Streptomyces sp. NPDC046876]|uniref:helix-turn-helix domain-containing protein n=1 Tax=Streptomyces sp. NPDC046876 TaxID=3155616 RepID=UPI0033F41890
MRHSSCLSGWKSGQRFLSAGELSSRLGVSRPTISKVLTQLEVAGVLSEGGDRESGERFGLF